MQLTRPIVINNDGEMDSESSPKLTYEEGDKLGRELENKRLLGVATAAASPS
jgi:hypothetical protein